jgi:hypothetical protein
MVIINLILIFLGKDFVMSDLKITPMGGWGKKIDTNLPDVHISQTNENSRDGSAAHVTTNISGTFFKVSDRFDAEGNYSDQSGFGKR